MLRNLIEYIGLDWEEYKMYPDIDNKFLASVAEQYRWNRYISQKQDEWCWQILMDIRRLNGLYNSYTVNDIPYD